jgi:hypothetical protein
VAYDKGIGLRAVQEAKGDARIGRMHDRTLTFDDIPMLVAGRRGQGFHRPGKKIRDDGIYGKAMAVDQHAGLPRGAKRGRDASGFKGLVNGKGRVFLSYGAIGSNSQEAVTAARQACGDGMWSAREAHVMDLAAGARRSGIDRRDRPEWHVQP